MRCFEKKDVVKKIIFTDLKENNSVNEFYSIQANTMKKKFCLYSTRRQNFLKAASRNHSSTE